MPKIRFPDDLRTVLSSAMKNARFASVRDVGKFIETARAVDDVITVPVSPDAAPTIASFVQKFVRRGSGYTTVQHEDGDDILVVKMFHSSNNGLPMQTYDLISVAEKAGVTIKSYGDQPNWAWDFPSSAGGCGLPSKYDAAQDAVRELRLSLKCACGARGVVMDAWTVFECGAEIACDGTVEQPCRATSHVRG